ncbi:hypothetical protein ABPG75_012328 [Micractinium tetrahymenae]
MRGRRTCLPLLAAALLCAAAAPAAAFGRLQLDPPPHADIFAWRALTTAGDAGVDRQVVNHCIDGSSVAGIWVAFKNTAWQSAGRSSCVAWTYSPGRIEFIRIYSHKKDANGDPLYVDFGSGSAGFGARQDGHWLALEPFEKIQRFTLRPNGFPGSAARLGAIRIETSSMTLEVDTWVGVPAGCRCMAEDGYSGRATGIDCPSSDRPATVTGQGDSEDPGLLGSGLFCGFYGTVAPNTTKVPGIREATPIFLNWVTRSLISNVQYTPGWQAALGPLSPQVAASVRVDNRGGPKASLTLKLADSTVDSSTASCTSGTTLVKESSVTVTLAAPKGAWWSGSGAELTKGGVWDTGSTETKGTTRDISTASGSTVKTTIGAGAWTQVVFANYKSSYDVAYTASMALTVENRRLGMPYRTATLAFNTSGSVRGVTTSDTRYTLCDLDPATGECPAIPETSPVAPPADPTAGVPPASSFDDAAMLADFFVTTPLKGSGFGGTYAVHGFRRCMEAQQYLFKIEAMNIGTDWASSLRLWYKQGTQGDPPVSVNVGKVSSGASVANSCTFAREDVIVSAATWDNGLCNNVNPPYNECRWGKTEFKIRRAASGKLETCTISAREVGWRATKTVIGPSQMQNIGSGRLCGVAARAGSDVDAVGWVFMRAVTKFETNVKTTASPGELDPPSVDNSISAAVDNRGHNYSVEASITPFTLTETLKQTWEESASSSFADKSNVAITGSLFEILKVGTKYGRSYTTSTKTVSGGTLTKSTTTDVAYTAEVPANGCTYLRTRQWKSAGDFAAWAGTAALTFDNGKRVALPVSGSSTFSTTNVYEIQPVDCSAVTSGSGGGLIRPMPRPATLGVRPPRAMPAIELLRELAADYKVPLASLRAWNKALPGQLRAGVLYTVHLAAGGHRAG